MTIIEHMRFACWIPKATSTYSVCVIVGCFFTATMVERMRLCVTFKRTLPVLLLLKWVVHKVCWALKG